MNILVSDSWQKMMLDIIGWRGDDTSRSTSQVVKGPDKAPAKIHDTFALSYHPIVHFSKYFD